jgi:hypothetical protein
MMWWRSGALNAWVSLVPGAVQGGGPTGVRSRRPTAPDIFDATAQTVAKSRLEALARNNSCGKNDQRCL